MLGYIAVAILGGIILGVMDGIINANPYAQKLFKVYKPIAKSSINIALGFVIDIFYSFVMFGLFLMLFVSLPGETALIKGLSFGLMATFFSVVMHVLSQLMMFKVPTGALVYMFFSGLIQMLLISIYFSFTLSLIFG